jgi:ATP-binding cassette subfamily C protein CydC
MIRLLGFLRPYIGWVILSVLFGSLTVSSGIGLLATSAYLISCAALHPSIAALQVAIVGVRFFGLARGFFRYLERYVSHLVNFSLLAQLRAWFYRAIEPLAPARLLDYRGGDLLGRAVGDIDALENFYVRVVSPLAVAGLTVLGIWLFFGRFNFTLAGVLLSFLLLTGVGLPVLVHRLSHLPGKDIVLTRSQLRADLVDGIQGLDTLLIYNQDTAWQEKIHTEGIMFANLQKKMGRINGFQAASGNLLTNLSVWVILFIAINLVNAGQLDGVYLSVLALAAMASFEAVLPLSQAAQYLETGLQSARRLFELADAQSAVSDAQSSDPAPQKFDIVVRDLSFSYTQNGPLILDHINFSLSRGKTLAIVGPSGAGKTTLINLLLRFWDYSEGQILLDQKDLRHYAQDDVRRSIMVISQTTYLFNNTIRQNLLLAQPQASQSQIEAACVVARIDQFIRSLPEGYDTWIGEHGRQLSGGERQRLAIARAVLKDAPILILDEPTANLDTLTELDVIHSLQSLAKNRAVLWATHRLVEMEHVDEILVLDRGQIVENGSHAGLIRERGLYQRMWQLQQRILSVDIQE